MQFEITPDQKKLMPPVAQAILTDIDDYLNRLAAIGKRVTEIALKDADFIYLQNRLQTLAKSNDPFQIIGYQGIHLVRQSPI